MSCCVWRRATWLRVALPALLLAAGGPAAAERFGPVEVVHLPGIPPSRGGGGYFEYRFQVVNRGQASHQVTLVLPPEGQMYGGALHQLRRTVTVAPGGSAHVTLLQPPLPVYGSNAGVLVDGRPQDGDLNVDTGYGYFNATDTGRYLLLSSAIAAQELAALDSNVYHLTSAEGSAGGWGEDWLAFTSFHGVLVTAGDVAAMSAGTRGALARYVEVGGSVLVLGAGASELSFDFALRGEPAACGALLRCTPAGLGMLVTTPVASVADFDAAEQARLEEVWYRTGGARLELYRGLVEANRRVPVVERTIVPVRGLFVLMLAFVLLIGPLNVRWLARRGRRMWLLWTVPAISLLTCLGVLGYALLAEGLTRYELAQGLTLLDQGQRRAISVGRVAFYVPLTSSEGLRFGYATELTPDLEGFPVVNGNRQRTVDWSRGQHLDRGWLVARLPTHLMVRKNEIRRERLVLQRAGDRLEVVNGLGADLRRLWLTDRDGRCYAAAGVPAGAARVLAVADCTPPVKNVAALHRELVSSWLEASQNPGLGIHPPLGPNSYLAELAGWPFLEEALAGASSRRWSMVYGLLGDGGPEGAP